MEVDAPPLSTMINDQQESMVDVEMVEPMFLGFLDWIAPILLDLKRGILHLCEKLGPFSNFVYVHCTMSNRYKQKTNQQTKNQIYKHKT